MSNATATDYKVSQKVIHWIMGLLIILDLFVASKFGHEMEIVDRLESRGDHASLGTILGTLLLLRILLRLRYGAPPLPTGMSSWQQLAARAGHGGMYFAMIGLIVTGVISALYATDPISIFQSFTLSLSNMDEAQFQFVRQFHEFCKFLMIGLIVVHVLAAGFHQWILKDDSARRMLKFWTSS